MRESEQFPHPFSVMGMLGRVGAECFGKRLILALGVLVVSSACQQQGSPWVLWERYDQYATDAKTQIYLDDVSRRAGTVRSDG